MLVLHQAQPSCLEDGKRFTLKRMIRIAHFVVVTRIDFADRVLKRANIYNQPSGSVTPSGLLLRNLTDIKDDVTNATMQTCFVRVSEKGHEPQTGTLLSAVAW